MPVSSHSSSMPVPPATVFAWHGRSGALERLLPPWQDVRVITRDGSIRNGDCTVLELGLGPFHQRWTAVHQDYREGESFTDVQESGPFARWEHCHRVLPDGDGAILEDRIDWALPDWAGWLAPVVERDLARLFPWRHRRTAQDLIRHLPHAERPALNVAISGASGLVGSALGAFLAAGGHRVLRLVRSTSLDESHITWHPGANTADPRLDGCDALVHLAGAGIADGLWTESRKVEIRLSRIENTRRLCEGLAHLHRPPRVLICASAIGFYGPTGDTVDESAPCGQGFLADICRDWEAACAPAVDAGIRVVHLRLGTVLSPRGGVLARLLPVFRMGLGGPLGDGRQPMPWIGLDDVVGAILHLLVRDDLAGPFNLTAPDAVDNAIFTDALASSLDRPGWLPVPGFAVRSLFGEMGESLLLKGRHVVPRRLQDSGFRFLTPTLDECLAWELGLPPAPEPAPAADVPSGTPSQSDGAGAEG